MSEPKPAVPPISLTILRGPHDLDIDRHTRSLLKDANILFLETVATRTEKDLYEQWANAISLKRPWDKLTAQQKIDATNVEQSGINKLILGLKGSNVLIRLVDETYDDGTDMAALIASHAEFEFPFALLDKPDPSKIYAFVEAKVAHFQAWTSRRDTLVAEQVVECLRKLRADYPALPLRAVLIQGYAHHSAADISRLMPSLRLDEKVYNPRAVDDLMLDSISELAETKRLHPDNALPRAQIERALLVHLTRERNDLLAQAGGKLTVSTVVDSYRKKRAALQGLSDEAVHQRFLELLETNRLKGGWRLIAPPVRLVARLFGRT